MKRVLEINVNEPFFANLVLCKHALYPIELRALMYSCVLIKRYASLHTTAAARISGFCSSGSLRHRCSHQAQAATDMIKAAPMPTHTRMVFVYAGSDGGGAVGEAVGVAVGDGVGEKVGDGVGTFPPMYTEVPSPHV